MRQIKSSAAPRERIVHEYDVAPTSQVVGRSPTRVVRSTKPNSTRVRVITEINQLLSANRTDAAMAVHTQHAGQAAVVRPPGSAAKRWCQARNPRTTEAGESESHPGVDFPHRAQSVEGRSWRRPSTRPNAVVAESTPM